MIREIVPQISVSETFPVSPRPQDDVRIIGTNAI